MKKLWKTAAIFACTMILSLAGTVSVKAQLPAKPYRYNGHCYMLYYSSKNWTQAMPTAKNWADILLRSHLHRNSVW